MSISPDRWSMFSAALDALESLVEPDCEGPIFCAVAEGRALLRAAGLVGEAPDAMSHPSENERAAAIKRRKVSTGMPPVDRVVKAQQSKQSGYTGEACSQCGNFTVRRKGTCCACDSCDFSTGCG